MSRSSVKVMVQLPLPWLELQRSSSMPLMVLTAASIGLVMVVSISSALAPGRPARTLTVGESVRGIRSSPRSRYETQPSTMSAALIITAKTGRRTLTSASFTACLSALACRAAAAASLPPAAAAASAPPPPGAPLSISTLTPVASSFSRLAASVSLPFRPSTISHRSPCAHAERDRLLRDLAVA